MIKTQDKIGFHSLPYLMKGESFKYKLKLIKREFVIGFQRFWKGYADEDWYDLDTNFRDKMILLLSEFKDHYCCEWKEAGSEFINLEEIHTNDKRIYYTKEESDAILDTMIFHLRMMDGDYVVDMKLEQEGVSENDVDCDFFVQCHNIANQNKQAFFKLFDKFYYQLWT